MKIVFLITCILFIPALAFCQTFTLKGVVTSKKVPLMGVTVSNETKKKSVSTDSSGKYSIEASVGDVISYSFIGFKSEKKTLKNANDINIDFGDSQLDVVEVVSLRTGPSVSMRNFWVGAKIGYNFTANTDDNFFVGSASIALNLLDNNNSHHTFGVVGNIGNFKFNKDTTDTKNIQKLSQSINGLSVGLGYTYESKIVGQNKYKTDGKAPVSYFREFVLTGARLTTYKNVGKDSATINFPQSVTTVGFEFEQTGFKNGGSITASVGLSILLFDKKLYKRIFDEDKKSLLIFDASIILPVSKNMGFFVNGTFAKKTSGIYIIGIIFKS